MALRTYTANDFIKKAFQLLNVIDVTDPVQGEMNAQGEDALQMMIDSWRTHKATFYATEAKQFALAASTQNYTIGPSATWDTAYPQWIEFWSLIPDRTAAATELQELPFNRVLTTVEWQRIPIKGTTASWPTKLFFDEAFNESTGRGTIKVWPIPTVSVADVVLYLQTPVSNFTTLTTAYLYKPGYVRTIVLCLAKELSLYYPGSLRPEVAEEARLAMEAIKRSNFRPVDAEFDVMLSGSRGSRYNIYTDG